MECRVTYLAKEEVLPNKGQVPGLPKNPRTISKRDFEDLKRSIQENPEMLELREVLVFPFGDKYVVIGGNMRLKAMKALGYEKIPVKILPSDTPVEKLKQILLKDNINKGEWDKKDLNLDWEKDLLDDIGIDFKIKAQWLHADNYQLKRIDLKEKILIHRKGARLMVTFFKQSKEGVLLSDVKRPEYVSLFADSAIAIIQGLLGINGSMGSWALVSAPRRHHKEGFHFATFICREIAQRLNIHFYEDIIESVKNSKNYCNITDIYKLRGEIAEDNVILYDDIATTGGTLTACDELLAGKNVMFVVGVWNNP